MTWKSILPKNRKLALLLGLVVLVIVGGISGKILTSKNSSSQTQKNPVINKQVRATNNVDYSPAVNDDNAVSEERKNDPSKAASTLDNGATASDTPLSIAITRASLNQSDASMQVATIVNGATTGTCKITASKSGQPNISRESTVELQANSYVCPIISIPVSDFTVKGDWNFSASITSDGRTDIVSWPNNPVKVE